MKEPISYLDFDLRIERDGDGYRAEVMNSPAGQGACVFQAPFSTIELENFLLRVGRPRHSTRRMDSPEIAAAKSYGGKLYESVMSGEVQARWLSSLTEAETQGRGLRLRLRIADAPELNGMPWEYLYNASLNRFLSLSERTPLVRYLELPERIKPLAVEAPISVLVAISSPSNYPKLDVEREWTQLQEALQPLTGSGLVVMERLTNPRLSVLRDKLRGGEYHMLHFIGHGGFDTGSDEGALVFCDQEGKGKIIGAQRFGTILHDHQSLRLVILNACEGSRTSEKDPFAGTAQTLVQQGVPAVIAMQFEITDPAAITFAKEFYTVVAGGHPVDAALAQARLAIFADENDIEWGTPVLYMRAQDGRIFTVRRDPNKPVAVAQPAPVQPQPVQPPPTQPLPQPTAQPAPSPSPPPRAPEPVAPLQTFAPSTPPPAAAPGAGVQRAMQDMQEIVSSTFGGQLFGQASSAPSSTPAPARQAPNLLYMLIRLFFWPLFLLPKLLASKAAPVSAPTPAQAPTQALAPTSAGQVPQAAPTPRGWSARRAGQIGLSILGVVIQGAGLSESYGIPEEVLGILFALVAISLFVVVVRWTWLLYLWGAINFLFLALGLVALADTSDYGSEQDVLIVTIVALGIEGLAIFFTIRGKRLQNR